MTRFGHKLNYVINTFVKHTVSCFTTITTINRYICTVDASKIILNLFFFHILLRNFFNVFCFVGPVPPLTQNATLICCVNVQEIFADKRAW